MTYAFDDYRVITTTKERYLETVLCSDVGLVASRVALWLSKLYNVEKGYAWPSLNYLVDKIGTRKDKIIVAIRKLEEAGLLVVQRSGYGCNRYIPKLDLQAVADELNRSLAEKPNTPKEEKGFPKRGPNKEEDQVYTKKKEEDLVQPNRLEEAVDCESSVKNNIEDELLLFRGGRVRSSPDGRTIIHPTNGKLLTIDEWLQIKPALEVEDRLRQQEAARPVIIQAPQKQTLTDIKRFDDFAKEAFRDKTIKTKLNPKTFKRCIFDFADLLTKNSEVWKGEEKVMPRLLGWIRGWERKRGYA